LTSSDLPSLETAALKVTVTAAEPDRVAVTLKGSGDHAAHQPFADLFARLHALLVERGAREVSVDIRDLEFLSASCLKTLVTWIGAVAELSHESQYRVRFRSNPRRHWQRRSVEALRCFATDLVFIET
jgi:hypothetical protein